MRWWINLGYYSFEAGPDGFPRTGQVIKYYRERTKNESGKRMSQTALADKLKISKNAMYNIEKKDTPLSTERRLVLCSLLSIPGILLNVHTPSDITKLLTAKIAPATSTALDLADHHQFLQSAFHYNKHSSALWMIDALLLRMDSLYRELPYSSQKREIAALLTDYNRLCAGIFREAQKWSVALEHIQKALILATEFGNEEARAGVLLVYGRILQEAEQLEASAQIFEQVGALHLSGTLRGVHIFYSTPVLTELHKLDRKASLSGLDQASRLLDTNPNSPVFDFSEQRSHLVRGKTLNILGEPKAALEELDLVHCTDGSWWQAYQYLYEAEVYLTRCNYPLAVSYARATLVIVQKFQSAHHIARITTIYRQVKATSYGKSGDVVELGELLAL